MKQLKLIPLIISCLLVSCDSSIDKPSIGPNNEVRFGSLKFVAPIGAQTLAFYNLGANPSFETNANPQIISSQFALGQKEMILFDSITGLRSSMNNGKKYRLHRIVTNGNFFLVRINRDVMPENPYYVSFGEKLIPSLVVEYLYPETNFKYVGSASDVAGVLATGLHEGNPVDYVVIPEPALYNVMHNANSNTYGKLEVISSFREEFSQKTGMNGFPQAGVFIREDSYQQYQSFYDSLLDILDQHIDMAINNLDAVATTMDHQNSLNEQMTKFGFTSVIAKDVQTANNGFGLVLNDSNIDINAFLRLLKLPEVAQDLINE
ncbi:MAG: hypothetical protein LBR37_02725 [Erysipelotrichaceae bacterium]|jgi:NitT/TauT family transport system substrate-binding protein|nr:hypothetical protein [Erysipelotrichaceae bacterium]